MSASNARRHMQDACTALVELRYERGMDADQLLQWTFAQLLLAALELACEGEEA